MGPSSHQAHVTNSGGEFIAATAAFEQSCLPAIIPRCFVHLDEVNVLELQATARLGSMLSVRRLWKLSRGRHILQTPRALPQTPNRLHLAIVALLFQAVGFDHLDSP